MVPSHDLKCIIIYLPREHKPVHIPNDVNDAIGVAMGDRVLSKDQEVTEHY